jgi:hypothetical protein
VDRDLTFGVGRIREAMERNRRAEDLAESADEFTLDIGLYVDDYRSIGGQGLALWRRHSESNLTYLTRLYI